MSVIALIAAAGKGSRFIARHDVAKQYVLLSGVPILRHSINAFYRHPDVDGVRVIIHPDDVELYEESVIGLDILPPVFGASTRQESVRLGLESLIDINPKKVLIHDAARPFLSRKIITAIIKQLDVSYAAIPAVPLDDTIKKYSNGKIMWTVERTDLWRAQTPQGFIYQDILKYHNIYKDKSFTDDAAVGEYAGIDVGIIPGSENNFKITTDQDYERAEFIASQQLDLCVKETRVGIGFDLHRFTSNESTDGKIILGGIAIDHKYKLLGHSDADVVLHAVTDAVLGAVGGGNIGHFFPSSDNQWKDADSSIFLEHACDFVRSKNGRIINVDIVIICEKPYINNWRNAMECSIAKIMHIDASRINVKGKTADQLGSVGRAEGICVQSVVSVSLDVITEIE